MTRYLRAATVAALLLALAPLALLSTRTPGALAAPAATGSAPGSGGRLLGFSAHTLGAPDRATYVGLASGAGATTIREDISWSSVEASPGRYDWSGPDELITRAANGGMALLLLVDSTPTWARVPAGPNPGNAWWLPPAKAADFGNFAAQVAARYGSNGTFWPSHPTVPRVLPAGIEVWNEPNLAIFWGGLAPDPARYAAMLADAYPKIKAADPAMTVISAGLAPAGGYNDVDCNGAADSGGNARAMNGVNFLQAVYANGGAGRLDGVGWHPYNYWAGATGSQSLAYHLCSAWSQMAQTPVSARSLMTANGDGAKGVWATELGAPSCIAGATYPCMTEAEQAALASQSLAAWQSYPWSSGWYWYDLRDDNGGTSTSDGEQHFGAARADNTAKPAMTALQAGFRSAAPPPSTVPSTTVPSTTVPSTTVPSTTVPSTTVPSTTVPSTTVPSTTVPSTTVPPSTVPSTTSTAVAEPTTTTTGVPVPPPVALPSGPPPSGNDILSGEVMTVGQVLHGPRSRFALIYQTDGNLVAYDRGIAYWATGTWGTSPGAVAFRADGSLAVFDSGGVVRWASPPGGSRFAVQRDGNVLLLRADGSVVWSSNTRRR